MSELNSVRCRKGLKKLLAKGEVTSADNPRSEPSSTFTNDEHVPDLNAFEQSNRRIREIPRNFCEDAKRRRLKVVRGVNVAP